MERAMGFVARNHAVSANIKALVGTSPLTHVLVWFRPRVLRSRRRVGAEAIVRVRVDWASETRKFDYRDPLSQIFGKVPHMRRQGRCRPPESNETQLHQDVVAVVRSVTHEFQPRERMELPESKRQRSPRSES